MKSKLLDPFIARSNNMIDDYICKAAMLEYPDTFSQPICIQTLFRKNPDGCFKSAEYGCVWLCMALRKSEKASTKSSGTKFKKFFCTWLEVRQTRNPWIQDRVQLCPCKAAPEAQ